MIAPRRDVNELLARGGEPHEAPTKKLKAQLSLCPACWSLATPLSDGTDGYLCPNCARRFTDAPHSL